MLESYSPENPLPGPLCEQLEDMCFDYWKKSGARSKVPADTENKKVICDLFSNVVGVLSLNRLEHVNRKLFRELGQPEEVANKDVNTLVPVCQGIRFLKLQLNSPERLSHSIQFISKIAQYLDAKHKKISPDLRTAICDLLASVLTPLIEAPVQDLDLGVWNAGISDLFQKVLAFERGHRTSQTIQILKSALICVGGPAFFSEHVNGLFDILLKSVKPGDKLRSNSLEALYRICLGAFNLEVDDAFTSKLCARLAREILPPLKKTYDPAEGCVDILVDIISLISISKLDFAVQQFVVPLLRGEKLFPERLIVGILAANSILTRLRETKGMAAVTPSAAMVASSSSTTTTTSFTSQSHQQLANLNLSPVGSFRYQPSLIDSGEQKGTLGKGFRKAALLRKSYSTMFTQQPAESQVTAETSVDLLFLNVPQALDKILAQLNKEMGSLVLTSLPRGPSTSQDVVKSPMAELLRVSLSVLVNFFPAKISLIEVVSQLAQYTIHVNESVRTTALDVIEILMSRPTLRSLIVNQFARFCFSLSDRNTGLVLRSLERLSGFMQQWMAIIHANDSSASQETIYSLGSQMNVNVRLEIAELEGGILFLLCSPTPAIRLFSLSLLKQVANLCALLPADLYIIGTRLIEAIEESSQISIKSVFSDKLGMVNLEGETLDFQSILTEIGQQEEVLAAAEQPGQTATAVPTSDSGGEASRASSAASSASSTSPSLASLAELEDLADEDNQCTSDDVFDKDAHLTVDMLARSVRTTPFFWGRFLGTLLGHCSRSCCEAASYAFQLLLPKLIVCHSVLDGLKANASSKLTLTFRLYFVAVCSLSQAAIMDTRNGPDKLFRFAIPLLNNPELSDTVLFGFSFVPPAVLDFLFTVLASFDAEVTKGRKKKQAFRIQLAHVYRFAACALQPSATTELSLRSLKTWILATHSYIEQNDEHAALHWLKYELLTTIPYFCDAVAQNPALCNAGEVLQLRALLYPFLERLSNSGSPAERRPIEELCQKQLKTPEERSFAMAQIDRQFRALGDAASKAITWVLLGLPFQLSSDLQNTPIFSWIDAACTSPHRCLQNNAQTALLHYSRGDLTNPSLLTTLIRRSYVNDRRISLNYFLVFSELVRNHNLNFVPRSLEVLNLVLFKLGDPNSWTVRESALLFFRFISESLWQQDYHLFRFPTLVNSFSHQQGQLSDHLATDHPELTVAFIAEVMERLSQIDPTHQAIMIRYASYWVKNIDLQLLDEKTRNTVLSSLLTITFRHGFKTPSLASKLWTRVAVHQENIEIALAFMMEQLVFTQNTNLLEISSQIVLILTRNALQKTFELIYTKYLSNFENPLPLENDPTRASAVSNPLSWFLAEIIPPVAYRHQFLRSHVALNWLKDLVIEFPGATALPHLLPNLFHSVFLSADYPNVVASQAARQLLHNCCFSLMLPAGTSPAQRTAYHALETAVMVDLVQETPLWVNEDTTYAAFLAPLPSTLLIKMLIDHIMACLGSAAGEIVESWGAESLNAAGRPGMSIHYIARSLQIYRCLRPRITLSACQALLHIFTNASPKESLPIALEVIATFIDVLHYSSVDDIIRLPHIWWAGVAWLLSDHTAIFLGGVSLLSVVVAKLDFQNSAHTQRLLGSLPRVGWTPPFTGVLALLLKGLVSTDERVHKATLELFVALVPHPSPILDVDPTRLFLQELLALLPSFVQFFGRPEHCRTAATLGDTLNTRGFPGLGTVLHDYSRHKFTSASLFLAALGPEMGRVFFPRYEMWTFVFLAEMSERCLPLYLHAVLDITNILLQQVTLETSLLRVQGISLFSSLTKQFDGASTWRRALSITNNAVRSLDPGRLEIAHSKHMNVLSRFRSLALSSTTWSTPDFRQADVAQAVHTLTALECEPISEVDAPDLLHIGERPGGSRKKKSSRKSRVSSSLNSPELQLPSGEPAPPPPRRSRTSTKAL